MISKIRDKASLALIIVVLGLLLLLVTGDLLGLSPRTVYKQPTIGKVAGKNITLRAFQEQYEVLQHSFPQQYGRMPTEVEKDSLRNQVWQQLLADAGYALIQDALGITVTVDELIDMVQGDYIHPDLQAAFTNPTTQAFDKQQLLLYLKNLAQMPAAHRQQFHKFEKRLATDRRHAKSNQLMEQSAFVTDLAARTEYQLAHTALAIRYLYIPYSSLQSDSSSITDAMLRDYLKAHKNDYQVAESRSMHCVTFPVVPTEEDKLALQKELQQLQQDFAQTLDDRGFASAHTEGLSLIAYRTYTPAELPQTLAQQEAALYQGMVIGPVEEWGRYKLYKIAAIHEQAPRRYEVAVIEKILAPGDEARDRAYRQADYFASMASNKKQFEAQAAQDNLEVRQAQADKNDSRVGVLPCARDIVRWLYNEAAVGTVSPVFELADEYVVAVMTDQVRAGTASLDSVRDEITRKVTNAQKAQSIISQLPATTEATLDDLAAQYGEGATILAAAQVKFSDYTLPSVGRARKAIGQAFALKPGERSKPIADDEGVLIIELVERQEAAVPENLAGYRQVQEQRARGKQASYILESLKELTNAKDYRYKYY
ncbi:MAG: SurA N-terminal domain-containing protein [Bacteroidota bacterium]